MKRKGRGNQNKHSHGSNSQSIRPKKGSRGAKKYYRGGVVL